MPVNYWSNVVSQILTLSISEDERDDKTLILEMIAAKRFLNLNILCQAISKKVYHASGGLLFWMFTIIFIALTIIVFPLRIWFVVSYFFIYIVACQCSLL